MLILARSEGQSIQIGDDIRITVTALGKGQVRIGIEAPRDLLVLRSEIVESIAAENRKSLGDAHGTAATAAALMRQLGVAATPGETASAVAPVRLASLAGRQRRVAAPPTPAPAPTPAGAARPGGSDA